MNVPSLLSTIDGTEMPSSIVRLASIPHGVSVMMQGPNPGGTPTSGAPVIPPIAPFAGYTPTVGVTKAGPPPDPPFPPSPTPVGLVPVSTDGGNHGVNELDVTQDLLVPNDNNTMSSGPFPAGFEKYVIDPNQMLRDAIHHQDILGFIAINLTSDAASTTGLPLDGIGSGEETVGNIPFLGIPFDQGPDPGPPGPPYTAYNSSIAPGAQAVTPRPHALRPREPRAQPEPQRVRVLGQLHVLDRVGPYPVPGAAAEWLWQWDVARGQPGLPRRPDRTVLGDTELSPAPVLADRDPDLQRRPLAARVGRDHAAERRIGPP